MRLYEDTQQETTCLQYFLPRFVFSSERRVLSDKKIKRQKKINLSLAENKILENKPAQKDENISLRTKAKQMNRLFRPSQNRVQSQKLTISSSLYKRTPQTNEQVCQRPIDSAKVIRKNKTSCFKIVDSERISFERCQKQEYSRKQQYENMPKKLAELRYLVIDNQIKNNNISRKINFAKSEKQDHKIEAECSDIGNDTRRSTQRLTHKKPPNFFHNHLCDFTQTKPKPLTLNTTQQPFSQNSWKQQTAKIISNHTKITQSENSLFDSLDHRTEQKKQIKKLQIKKSDLTPDEITVATIREQKMQSQLDLNKYQIIPLLDELRKSLERNEQNRAFKNFLDKYDPLKQLSPIRNHASQIENQSKSQRESETALKNKDAEFSQQNEISSQQVKNEQPSSIQYYRQSFPCQKPTQKIADDRFAVASVRKQPLKKLLEGVNTIVSKYDDDSSRKSGSDAFSHVIFRLNGEGQREMMSEQNESEKQYGNVINFDYRLGGQRKFQKRFGFSYKDAESEREKDIDSIKDRQSYNKFSKKITFSQHKSNALSHEECLSIQPPNSLHANKVALDIVVDEVPKQFSPKNGSVESEQEIDWQKRIQEIYITNQIQNPHPQSSDASNNPDILSSFEQSIVVSRTISRPNSASFLKFEQRFRKLNYLGVGRYSSVYLFLDVVTHFIFAMKEMFKFLVESTQCAEQLKKQIEIQGGLSHPNVIQLYDIYEDEKKIYLMVEYGGGNLYQLLENVKQIPEKQCIEYVRDIALGLKYLHENRIVHRDIKPQNILVINGVCKIADFGCAGYLPHSEQYFDETLGTPLYISPQIDKLESYTFKTDCWSLGVLAYQIRTHKLDVSSQNSINPTHLFVNDNGTSQQYKEMVRLLLVEEESSRVSIQQLLKLPIFTN